MISFEFLTSFEITPDISYKQWLKAIIRKEGLIPGDIAYQFCDDDYLLVRNLQFLNHDTLTDIITFDKRVDNVVSGDVMISLDRVVENAHEFGVSIEQEFLRVVAHGVLHLCGYKDKTDPDAKVMRRMEEESIDLFYAMKQL